MFCVLLHVLNEIEMIYPKYIHHIKLKILSINYNGNLTTNKKKHKRIEIHSLTAKDREIHNIHL